jgi:hypothetical protein
LDLVVGRAIGDRPAMVGAFVDLALVFSAPSPESCVELFDGLRGHALVVGGVSEIEAGRDRKAQNTMGAVWGIGRQPPPWKEAAAAILSGRETVVYNAILPVKQWPTTPILSDLTDVCFARKSA